MKNIIKDCVPSIEECLLVVDGLLQEGTPKENILVITNFGGKNTILRNFDLRGRSGRVISAHRLSLQTRGIFHLQEYEDFQSQQPDYQKELDPVYDYWQEIENGDIAILVRVEE